MTRILSEQAKVSKRLRNKERAQLEGGPRCRRQQLKRIIARDGGLCALCGLIAIEPSRDHIISIAEWKADNSICTQEYLRSDENIQLMCTQCNLDKGAESEFHGIRWKDDV